MTRTLIRHYYISCEDGWLGIQLADNLYYFLHGEDAEYWPFSPEHMEESTGDWKIVL